MRFRAAIFDLDGTLVDSLADIANAANEVLEKQGFPTHPIADYRYFVGDGVSKLFQRILPAAEVTDERLAESLRGFDEVYGRICNQHTKLYDGVVDMIAELREMKVALAVLSNKPQHFTEQVVSDFFPQSDFAVVAGQRNEIPRKPDPAGAHVILQTLGVAPTECVYLGDTAVDMLTACRAGLVAVGALWGFRTRDELQSHGAHYLIEHPREFTAIVRGE
ncbi:MAG: HAD family hydrolase [Planctomycetota bacterium]